MNKKEKCLDKTARNEVEGHKRDFVLKMKIAKKGKKK